MIKGTKLEAHVIFEHRMNEEREELGRAIREQNYARAAAIAQYILNEIQRRRND